jgi:hypothetical protein
MRDIDTIDSELRLVAALRRAALERGGPLPTIDVADGGEPRVVIAAVLSPRHLDRLVAGARGFMQGCKALHRQFGGTWASGTGSSRGGPWALWTDASADHPQRRTGLAGRTSLR